MTETITSTGGGTIEHDVAVHKANLPMATGESVYDFTSALGEAARAYVYQQKRMDNTKSDYAYMCEVYPGTCILSYSIYGDKSAKPQYGYVSLAYTRDADTKAFKFSDMTEVERVTTYRAKSQMKITKGMDGASAEVELFDPGEGAPGWQPTSKQRSALWKGVL